MNLKKFKEIVKEEIKKFQLTERERCPYGHIWNGFKCEYVGGPRHPDLQKTSTLECPCEDGTSSFECCSPTNPGPQAQVVSCPCPSVHAHWDYSTDPPNFVHAIDNPPPSPACCPAGMNPGKTESPGRMTNEMTKGDSLCPCNDGSYSYECCPENAVPQGKQTKGCPCPQAPEDPNFPRDTTNIVQYSVHCCPDKGGMVGNPPSGGLPQPTIPKRRTSLQEIKNILKKVVNHKKYTKDYQINEGDLCPNGTCTSDMDCAHTGTYVHASDSTGGNTQGGFQYGTCVGNTPPLLGCCESRRVGSVTPQEDKPHAGRDRSRSDSSGFTFTPQGRKGNPNQYSAEGGVSTPETTGNGGGKCPGGFPSGGGTGHPTVPPAQ